MRKSRLSVLIAIVLIGSVGLALIPTLNYSGFCLSQGRFLTDQEIIEIGASDYLQRYLPLNYEQFVPSDRPVAFSSLEDFMSKHPDCCSVTRAGRHDVEPSFFHRIMGHFAGFTRIEYEFDEPEPNGPEKRVVWVAVSNCGEPWNGISWER